MKLLSYIKFLFTSTNAHGVHSPFVFDLVQNCFYDQTKYFEYEFLKDYAYYLKEKDKKAETSFTNAKLIFRIVNYFGSQNILEFGTGDGSTTIAFYISYPKSKITSIEESADKLLFTQKIFLKLLKVEQFDEINFINTTYKSYITTLSKKETTGNWNLIYISKKQKPTGNIFEQLLPGLSNNSVLVVENIHASAEIENAWEAIKNNPSVSVTIDTFTLGLAFFRNEQQKEHFVIRPHKSVVLDFVLGIPKLWGMLS